MLFGVSDLLLLLVVVVADQINRSYVTNPEINPYQSIPNPDPEQQYGAKPGTKPGITL